MDFQKISDRKLKEFIRIWEEIPSIRTLNDLSKYIKALQESYKRFSDESYWKIQYFKEHPEATIEDFQMWFREI